VFAANPVDGVRSYVEDWGGSGSPVLVYAGLADPIEEAQGLPLVQALAGDYRMIFADHRGHGRSDKPHDPQAYALPTRVADATAVLDELGIDRAHVLGFSWGARLGFAIGEYTPERARSLVLCGNQPYAWDPSWPAVPMLTRVLDAADTEGMQGFLDTIESELGSGALPEQTRARTLANDPLAIAAAWRSALSEGAISPDLGAWRVPCLIYVAADDDMAANAERAAREIPTATFLALSGESHLSAPYECDRVLPAVRDVFASADMAA
jgi:pimeloyl-ACP methyl ester carboxylesterase